MKNDEVRTYGVQEQAEVSSAYDLAVETISRIGYAIVGGGYENQELTDFANAFEIAQIDAQRIYGHENLVWLGENNTIRALLVVHPIFLSLAANPHVLEICRRLIGNYFILNQQNGVISPPSREAHTQNAFHRDLPYQHFVSSRPLAISAIFCIDSFTDENGATELIPASQKIEEFPSDTTAQVLACSIQAPAGSFIVFDSMLYHRSGINQTSNPRRGINQMYTIPYFRQQIDLPAALGKDREFDFTMKRLLGYHVQTPHDVATYYAGRRNRVQS